VRWQRFGAWPSGVPVKYIPLATSYQMSVVYGERNMIAVFMKTAGWVIEP